MLMLQLIVEKPDRTGDLPSWVFSFASIAVDVIGKEGLSEGLKDITCMGFLSHHSLTPSPHSIIRSPYRGLGTHISFVRSVLMDAWTDREISLLKEGGGNAACRDFLIMHGLKNFDDLTHTQKYDSSQAELYRQVLKARIEGQPEPTALPTAYHQTSQSTGKKKMEGFGSAPRPSESNSRGKDLRRCLYVTATVFMGAALWVVVPK
jgi:hypothetical protein